MQRWQKIVALVVRWSQFWPGVGASARAAERDGRTPASDQGRDRLLAHGPARRLRRRVHPGPALRARVRDEGHEQGQRPHDRADARRRRHRSGEGRRGGQGPDRQGLQDHRRQRLVGRRAADGAARRAEQGPLHLRPGGDRRDHRASTSTRSAPAARRYQDVDSRRARSSAAASARRSSSSRRTPRSARATSRPSTRSSARQGHTVGRMLVPLSAQDFTPFAQQVKQQNPDLLFVAWAGTTAPAMWRALEQQGVFGVVDKIVTGPRRAGDVADVRRRSPRRSTSSRTTSTRRRRTRSTTSSSRSMRKRSQVPDLFTPDGFVAGQMIVPALDEGPSDDVDKMISRARGLELRRPEGAADDPRVGPRACSSRCSRSSWSRRTAKWQRRCRRSRSAPGTRRAAGEDVTARRPDQRGSWPSAPILATRNLGLDIGGATIVADVSLEVRAGEFVGIIGPNGAGKTTLFNLLSGLDPPDGRARRARRAATSRATPPYRRTQAGLGRTFQVSSVFPLLSVARERAARRGGRARRHAADLAPARARSATRSSGRAEALGARRARRPRRAGPPGCSRTATSASSSSRCCSPATRT